MPVIFSKSDSKTLKWRPSETCPFQYVGTSVSFSYSLGWTSPSHTLQWWVNLLMAMLMSWGPHLNFSEVQGAPDLLPLMSRSLQKPRPSRSWSWPWMSPHPQPYNLGCLCHPASTWTWEYGVWKTSTFGSFSVLREARGHPTSWSWKSPNFLPQYVQPS